MKKKYLIMVLLVTMLSGLLLTACGNEKEPAPVADNTKTDEQTIRWITATFGETGETKSEKLIKAFEKESGIKVEIEYYSFGDLPDVLEAKSVAKSTDFDVMSVDVTYISKYALQGYIAPLDEYFSNEEKAEFAPASYDAGVWDDQMFAAARNTSTQLLFYNKKLTDEAGITVPETGPDNRISYDQVADLARQVLDKLDPDGSKGLVGFDFQQASRVYQMNMLPNSMGGKNISEDGYSIDGVVNTEPWIEAMTWYQDLVNKGIASKGYNTEEVEAHFQSGKMIFMIGGTWTPSNMLVDDEVGYAYAPYFEGYEDKVATATGSWYFGINSNSKNQDAAAEFIKFMTLGAGNDEWLELNGDVPARIEKLDEISNNPEADEMFKIAAYEAGHTAFPRAVTPLFGEYSSILDRTWEDVRNGADVKESIDSAVKQFESAATY